jgi:hypothetical protein
MINTYNLIQYPRLFLGSPLRNYHHQKHIIAKYLLPISTSVSKDFQKGVCLVFQFMPVKR